MYFKLFLIVAHHGPHCEANNSQDDTSRSYTETSGRQTETSGRQTKSSGGQTETSGGQTETSGGQTETSSRQTENSGRQGETSGGQTETSGGQTETSGGLVNPEDNLFISKLTLVVPPAGEHCNTYHSHFESHSCSWRLLVPYTHSFQVNTVLIDNYLYYYYC